MEYGKTRSLLAEWRADCSGYDDKKRNGEHINSIENVAGRTSGGYMVWRILHGVMAGENAE